MNTMNTMTYGPKNHMGNVAGVTFPNDNGVHRQYILRTLLGENDYKAVIVNTEITTYEDEPAVKLYTANQQVGWLPKEMAPGFTDKQLTGIIRHHAKKNIYYMELYKYEKPTQRQYHYVKDKGLKPAYIKQEYSRVITDIKKTEHLNEKTIEDFLI